MPIKVQSDLPVRAILEKENIFVMDETRALNQDIRPLKIGIFKSDALKGGYGASAFALSVEYASAA